MIAGVTEPSTTGSDDAAPDATALVKGLRDLGGTFLLAGRFLTLRTELLTSDLYEQLSRLGEGVAPAPWATIAPVLNQGLAGEEASYFESFSPTPVSADIFLQRHRALLKDGTPVVVKFLRPDARQRLADDYQFLPDLYRLMKDSGVDPLVGEDVFGQELREWFERLVDLKQELANIVRLRHLARTDPFEHVPYPYEDLSSDSILVTDWNEGLALADLRLAVGGKATKGRGSLSELGVDARQLGLNIADVSLRQIFRHGFFQADYHPRNVMVLAGDVVSFADYSHCVEADAITNERLLSHMVAVFSDDAEGAFDLPLEPVDPRDNAELVAFRRDLVRGIRERFTADSGLAGTNTASRVPGLSTQAETIVECLRASQKHRVALPKGADWHYRTVVVAQQAAGLIGPIDPLVASSRRILQAAQLRVAMRHFTLRDAQPTLLSLLALVRDSPGQIQKLLSDLNDGSFVLSTYVTEAPQVARSRDRRTRVVVAAICSVSMALLLTVPHLPMPFGISIGWPLGATLGLLYIWLFLQWSRLR